MATPASMLQKIRLTKPIIYFAAPYILHQLRITIP